MDNILKALLNGPKPKYRRVIPIPNGKHGMTYKVYASHEPPNKKDVAFKSAHNRQGFPTG